MELGQRLTPARYLWLNRMKNRTGHHPAFHFTLQELRFDPKPSHFDFFASHEGRLTLFILFGLLTHEE